MLTSFFNKLRDVKIVEVWHQDSPGVRVYVRRGWWKRFVASSSFSEVGETHVELSDDQMPDIRLSLNDRAMSYVPWLRWLNSIINIVGYLLIGSAVLFLGMGWDLYPAIEEIVSEVKVFCFLAVSGVIWFGLTTLSEHLATRFVQEIQTKTCPVITRTAEAFHDTYEELAPTLDYRTRQDTRVFDPESRNGRLMIATVIKLIEDGKIAIPDHQYHTPQ